jgi:hypothetical protein
MITVSSKYHQESDHIQNGASDATVLSINWFIAKEVTFKQTNVRQFPTYNKMWE